MKDAKRAAVLDALNSGLTNRSTIAAMCGCAVSYVSRVARAAGHPPPPTVARSRRGEILRYAALNPSVSEFRMHQDLGIHQLAIDAVLGSKVTEIDKRLMYDPGALVGDYLVIGSTTHHIRHIVEGVINVSRIQGGIVRSNVKHLSLAQWADLIRISRIYNESLEKGKIKEEQQDETAG